jgi:copper oxidase (laccase) domain-containing protein
MCSQIASLVGADAIVALQQTHSNFGMIINQPLEQDRLYAGSGDFMITQTMGLALAIFTADCIPLVIYSPLHKAVALVHIGWRGAVGEIVQTELLGGQAHEAKSQPRQVERNISSRNRAKAP